MSDVSSGGPEAWPPPQQAPNLPEPYLGTAPVPYGGALAAGYPAVPSPYKDMTAAYLLWFFLGGWGAHAFYLRQTGKAVTMLALTVIGLATSIIVIGFLPLAAVSVWLLVDAFLIPGRLRQLNLRIASTNAVAHAQLGPRPF